MSWYTVKANISNQTIYSSFLLWYNEKKENENIKNKIKLKSKKKLKKKVKGNDYNG